MTGHFPRFKRFCELYNADPAFREAYRESPEGTLHRLGLDADRALVDAVLAAPPGTACEGCDVYRLENVERARPSGEITRQLLEDPVADRRFDRWRQRQLSRLRAICHPKLFHLLFHIPIVFELCEGCSGGCPFCCLAPPPLKSIFPYTEAHRKLWREILEVSRRLIGPLARYATCYYATEPFDNPAYESFARDFHAVNGWWPHLTTLKHLEDPARIRRYLAMVGDLALKSNMVRFSIISLEMLRRVHAEYSPEELEHVSLILNNPESAFKYSPAGRARKLLADWGKRGAGWSDKFDTSGPVTCVTGFIVNLPARSIRLVAPCEPGEAHPCSFILFDEARFADAADFAAQLEGMIERNMPDSPRPGAALAFAPDFSLRKYPGGIALSSRFMTRRFPGDENWAALAELIRSGRHAWEEIELIFHNPFLTEYYLKPKVQSLYDCGMLLEERAPAPQARGEGLVRAKQSRAAE